MVRTNQTKRIRRRSNEELKRIKIIELQKIEAQTNGKLKQCYIPTYDQITNGAIPKCEIQPFTKRRCPSCAKHPTLPNRSKICHRHNPPRPSCANCQFTKRKIEQQTNIKVFQDNVKAEIEFLKKLPEDEKEREAIKKMRDTIRREIKAKERAYCGPPLLTENDNQLEEERQQALTKKFNRESAEWFKIKKAANIAYHKELILAKEITMEAKDVEFIAQKRENDQLKQDIAKMMQDINKLQTTMKANIARYKASDEELLLQIILNNDIQDPNNTNDKGVLPTDNSQPSSPKRVEIEIIHEPPTSIPLCNIVSENNPLSPHSYDPVNTIDDLIHAELNNMDLFDGIDMVPNHDDTQDINNIGTIMRDINELFPAIPFNATIIEKEQNLKEINEAETIKHLLSSTDGGNEEFIDNIEIMEQPSYANPLSPPSPFQNNS